MTEAMTTMAAGRNVEDRGDHVWVGFDRPACIYCAGGLSNDEQGSCFNPYCGLAVHVFPVERGVCVGLECGQASDPARVSLLATIIETALYELAEIELEEELAARTPEQVAADEADEVEHAPDPCTYEAGTQGDFYMDASEVGQLLAVLERFQINHTKSALL